ncbi:hypothetical protein V8G54_034781, partial [Vigna mungo]
SFHNHDSWGSCLSPNFLFVCFPHWLSFTNENACTNTSIVDDIVFDKYLLWYLLSYDVFIMQHGNDRHDSCHNTEYKYCIILFTFVLNIIFMRNCDSSCLKNINSHFQSVNSAAYNFINFHDNSDAYNNLNFFISILMLTTISDRLT